MSTRRRRRCCARAGRGRAIGAAGMIVELFIAALAFYLWMRVEPGLLRAVLLQRDARRRRLDARLQRQPAAALRRLLHPRRPGRDAEPGAAVGALLGLPGRSATCCGCATRRRPPTRQAERAWFAAYGLLVDGLPALRDGRDRAVRRYAASSSSASLLALWAVAMMAVAPLVKALKAARRRARRCASAAAALYGIARRHGGAAGRSRWSCCRCRIAGRRPKAWSGCPSRRSCAPAPAASSPAFDTPPGTPGRAGQPLAHSCRPGAGSADAAAAGARRRARSDLRRRVRRRPRTRRDRRASSLRTNRRRWRVRPNARRGCASSPQRRAVFTVPPADDLAGRHLKQGRDDRLRARRRAAGGAGRRRPGVESTRCVGDPRRSSCGWPATLDIAWRGRIVRQVPAGRGEVPSRALVASGGGRIAGRPARSAGAPHARAHVPARRRVRAAARPCAAVRAPRPRPLRAPAGPAGGAGVAGPAAAFLLRHFNV